ncbi:MAG: DinB family protein [Chloroflexi bacterium]|nr:DinB family protein [Chloroflexota bacterium]MCC6891457.1 maleylpyruvate isomerase N-terminal domain-containing protein [Anaerolineae bacterium]
MPEMPTITAETLIAVLDTVKTEFTAAIDEIDVNSPSPAPGEWNARQVLSHVIGSLQQTPVQAGFFLAGAPDVPVIFSDPYWIAIWHNAPAESFKAALLAAVEGNKAFVRSLAPENLYRTAKMGSFGDTPLAVFLMISYNNHVKEQHLHQLRTFVSAPQPT